MTCPTCHNEAKAHGYDRSGNQRLYCRNCRQTFGEPRRKPLGNMYLPVEKAELILRMLLEGNSVSSVARLLDVHIATVLKLLVKASKKCERIMAEKIPNVEVRDVECDELWAYIGKRQKRARPEDDPNLGDCYTFVAIERNTKLVLNIANGKRDQATTDVFIEGLRHATRGEFQITTDGFAPYRTAIPNTLEDRCDFAMLIKVYKAATEGEARYSPAGRQRGGSPSHGPSRSGAHLYFDCRTVQFEHAHERPSIHQIDERLFKEVGEPLGSGAFGSLSTTFAASTSPCA